jgi:hypothetical protein
MCHWQGYKYACGHHSQRGYHEVNGEEYIQRQLIHRCIYTKNPGDPCANPLGPTYVDVVDGTWIELDKNCDPCAEKDYLMRELKAPEAEGGSSDVPGTAE